MSVKKYKFVSPGVFVKEIDNSALTAEPVDIGPLVIGRTARGPGMRPVQVTSFSEFINIFGNPVPGGDSQDVFRENAILAPTYAAYQAQAWLANNSPINVIRLLGREHAERTTEGRAGWMTKNSLGVETRPGGAITNGGSYGLFLMASSSQGSMGRKKDFTPATGSLAAVFYITQGSITLSGTIRGGAEIAGTDNTSSNGVLIESRGAYHEYIAEIKNAAGARTELVTFNFDESSPKFIRSVFNTNPTLTNTAITRASQQKNYWLGETYERFVLFGDGHQYGGIGVGSAVTGSTYGAILGLEGPDATGGAATTNTWSSRRNALQASQTGWVISQDLGVASAYNAHTVPKLFKFHAHESGQWEMHNLKISVTDIKKSTNKLDKYGTFTVLIRKANDSDGKMQIVERFSNCNLNPASPKYLARVVGDRYIKFSSAQRRNVEYGQYDNQSNFVRVEMNEDLDEGAMDPLLLPFGFFGPPRMSGWSVVGINAVNGAGKSAPFPFGTSEGIGVTPTQTAFVTGARGIVFGNSMAGGISLAAARVAYAKPRSGGKEIFLLTGPMDAGAANRSGQASASFTGAFVYPTFALRSGSNDDGLRDLNSCYWGFNAGKQAGNVNFEKSNFDIARSLPENLNLKTFNTNLASDANAETAFIFSLDNVVSSSDGKGAHYASGSRHGRPSTSTQDESISKLGYNSKVGYEATLEFGVNKFTMPLFGGIDGFDITEKDPFRNDSAMAAATSNEYTNYAFNSVKETIDMISDPESLDFNMASIPGVYTKALTSHLLDTVEDRGDALAIIDLEGDFKPASENTESYKARVDNAKVSTTVANLRDRELNSSYGCAYFPWVQIYDSINDRLVYTPPSVVAMGTMSNSEAQSELWFAPAGFSRGGLTGGAAGVPVVGITQKLTSDDRDDLYEAAINPIASFPAEGIVVFGQKTLQVTPSALDRVNVRRLMIFLKKRISQIAARILFDQNVEVTWNRFIGEVDPFLMGVKTGLGLTDYKVVLDDTTTTPDLVDRNILYAKIFLKPARAIEYIAIDFNISRTGAAFED